ncbi:MULTISPECIES: DUF7344 domain-containing protein [Salinibaculum]|uniref:DUF7344 domain-containing protein n=1 Tax=Salinibaculum TaxID=2732368 RepID=UPI0030D5ACDE
MSQSPTDSTREYAGIEDLPTSDRHKLLAAECRRAVLDILTERAGPVDLEELAVAIAAREAAEDAVNEKTVERVAIGLHHNHLPLMAEFGVIDYDPEATLVE